ncbi:DUF3006 domain-containing protein [Natronorarus salvus]|uniref:DUF3006 domain-containing protein n=1 Tax=Natronorarus salvus TaxID=3117733 RepID=UPI002F2650AB
MIDDGEYTAVVDRIEEGLAVVIVESEGEPIEEFHLGPEELPEGVSGGAVCQITVCDDAIEAIEPDRTATDERRESARSRFDRLSRRPDDPEN